MKTRIIKSDDLTYAAEVLRSGGLVGVPSETVYGLAANAFDSAAVSMIYEVKGRPDVEPLNVLVPNISVAATVCAGIPRVARLLAEAFWPGPLTIVLPRRNTLPHIVTAGSHTVGVRCPDVEKTLLLMRMAGVPLALSPASISDTHIIKSADEVFAHYDGKINCIIDGGRSTSKAEPTVVSLVTEPYKIIRHGALPEEKISHVLSLLQGN